MKLVWLVASPFVSAEAAPDLGMVMVGSLVAGGAGLLGVAAASGQRRTHHPEVVRCCSSQAILDAYLTQPHEYHGPLQDLQDCVWAAENTQECRREATNVYTVTEPPRDVNESHESA